MDSVCFTSLYLDEVYTPTKPAVKFEMELSESMQNQYGKQFEGGPTPGKKCYSNSKKKLTLNIY